MTDRPTVLVVDDEADVRLLCRLNLEFEGYDVVEAEDGEEAVRLAAEERPDAVLLDVMMPRMDGWEVLAALKADEDLRDIPVVMLTARAQDHDQIRGWSGGAAEYVTKPFSPLALCQVLRAVLDGGPTEEEQRRRLVLDKLQQLRDT